MLFGGYMEAILISPDRIKIMMSGKDLENYSIKGEDISDSVSGSVLRRILNDIGKKVGFESSCGRLHVQVYPLRGGGCEMFVTRLPEELEKDGGIYALSLNGREDAAMLMARLNNSGYSSDIRLYGGEEELFLISSESLPLYTCDYGAILPAEALPYIKEYARRL